MRAPNAIDFWRGFALVTIFINHVPGMVFDRFTSRNYSVSDSAELFVFLAGWSMRYVVKGLGATLPTSEVAFRLYGRAVQLYAAQMVISVGAIALIAGAALWLEQPLLLEWNNADAIFVAPAHAHVGLALLSYQLGYFNILPLYIVLMLAAPPMAILDKVSPWLLLAVSGAIWLTALATGANFATWPVEGRWFFNPLSWQFVFALGFLAARADAGPGLWVRRNLKILRWAAAPVVVAGAISAWNGYSPNPADVPQPRLFFLFDKTFASPARLGHFLCLICVMSGAWSFAMARAPQWGRRISAFLALLGRNSLNVFCAASLLSLCAQIIRFAYSDSATTDTAMLCIGVGIMGLTAWFSEWRDRSKARRLAA